MRPKIFDILFHDDRMFVLEICLVKTRTGNNSPKNEWAVITRRNVPEYPPYRSDTFNTKEEALDYYNQVVILTPIVSNNNKPKDPPPTLKEYQDWLIFNKMYDPILNPNAPTKKDALTL